MAKRKTTQPGLAAPTDHDRERHQQLVVFEQPAPPVVTCATVTPAPIPPTRGWWNATGRGIVGVMLIGAGVAIVITSMEANAWQGHAMTVDESAGDIFSRLSVLAEGVACLLPTANQFYWDD